MKPLIRFPRKLLGMWISHWHTNKKQNALAPPNDIASIAWMNKIAILCARIYEKVMRPNIFALARTILHSTDMQYINLFLNICNRDIKRRFRSIDTVGENFARCQTKIIGTCMYHWISCTYKKLCMDLAFIHILLCYSQVHVVNSRQASGRGDNDESLGTTQLS